MRFVKQTHCSKYGMVRDDGGMGVRLICENSTVSVSLLSIDSTIIWISSGFFENSNVILHCCELISNDVMIPFFSISIGLSEQAFMY